LPGFLLRIIREAREEKVIADRLAAEGLTHLLIRQDLFLRFLNDNLTPIEAKIWIGFGNRYLRPVFGEQGYVVYEIRNAT
jgi:hypothetical protein